MFEDTAKAMKATVEVARAIQADARALGLSDAGSEVVLLNDRVQQLLKDRSLLLVACIKAWDELGKLRPEHPMLKSLDELTGQMTDKVIAGK